MASAKDDDMDAQQVHIKEEDCEWGTPVELYEKLEDHEEQISVFKEEECKEENVVKDSKDFSVGLELQNHENGKTFKQDVWEESHSNSKFWFTNMTELATQQNSMVLKSELSEFEEKNSEGYRREAEGQKISRIVGINLRENGSFSTSSFVRPSLQCRLIQKRKLDNEKINKSTRSETLPAASSQCSSLPVAKQAQAEAVISNLQLCKQIQIHTGEKPHYCLECGKRFSHRSSLCKHKKIHTGDKPHCCSKCDKCFLQKSNLNIHMKVHTGEKSHCCPECGKRFSRLCKLQSHTRIHTGEKSHCCLKCGKQFCGSSSLQEHTRIHTGEKPYVCSECGKQFSHSSSFQKHKNSHWRKAIWLF
ncbi:zinc finger and SCAN domain-containing protein 2-like [Erpetoichthys calabaricus]|uniref:Zinc finger and SCAN domain-containing protein 2-like n=1 Tax=Erpetoichthys calabaricus TaxID=27687 RepID=A0A8C4T6J7_ERPCA|nr:zinc finger and SCAN domain-containing protein 2-like [Erpetoichthys calabaricus]